MNHLCPSLRAFAAACLFFTGSVALGAAPPTSDDAVISSLQDAYARTVTAGEQADLHRELLATVLQRVRRSHATEVDLAALSTTALKVLDPLPAGSGDPAEVFRKVTSEVLRGLDPYSRYLDAQAHSNARSESSGSFVGVGLQVEPGDGAVRVVAPIPGGPAARAGLAAGDLIVRVDDQSLRGLALGDAIARMRGQPGTPVAITVQRAGTAGEFTVSLTRDTIRRQVLRWSMEDEVLVLRLSGFTSSVSASLTQAISDATAGAQPRAVVLDLRGNPGGLLREAIRIADSFLGQGEIVSLRGNAPGRQRTWQADADEVLTGVPMVVLVDARSASASELVADALQHSGRATVMGQRSFGKGSVQTTFPLGDSKGALKLTTAIYHGPSGQTVHRVGVVPDIELLAPAKGASAADGAPAPAGAAPTRTAAMRVDPGRCTATKAADPALACALAYLRAGSADAFVAGLAD